MDPLHQLWELYDKQAPRQKPEPRPTTTSGIGSPNEGNFSHPVTQQRQEIDDLRSRGMTPSNAHQAVHGQTDISDPASKSELSSTLGRVQDDNEKNDVKIDGDGKALSIMAMDAKMEKEVIRGPESLKTPMSKEGPVDALDRQEEYDYNMDVAYLQKYGRA